jgi:hypothetical protein
MQPCGKCYHIRYCDALSEWYCSKWHTFLGYSIQAYKSYMCDIIGQEGDVREMKAMFNLIMENLE